MDDPSDWPLSIEGAEIVTGRANLTDPRDQEPELYGRIMRVFLERVEARKGSNNGARST